MGRPKGPKKDEFDSLSDAYKDAILQGDEESIKRRISEVAILEVEMRKTLKDDPAVSTAKEELKNLMEPYREDFKAYKLQIRFAKRALDDKGKA